MRKNKCLQYQFKGKYHELQIMKRGLSIMIILQNEFTSEAIAVSLADIGIDTENLIDMTNSIGAGDGSLYLPFINNDKLVEMLEDTVRSIAFANGYFNYHSPCFTYEMSVEESEIAFPNVFSIAYKAEFDLVYSPNEETWLQIWIEAVDSENDQYFGGSSLVLETIPVQPDNDEIKYLLNACAEAISLI